MCTKPIVLPVWAVSMLAMTLAAEVPSLDRAKEQFRIGRFAEAEQLYIQVLEKKPKNYGAALGLGKIKLLGNRFKEAEKWLKTAVALKKGEKEPKVLLAEAYYRQDRFADALPLLQEAGAEAKAKQLAAFGNLAPNSIEGEAAETEIPFEITDPLPVLKLKANGEEALFLLDTGGAELMLDPEFAEKIGARVVGQTQGTFAGGAKATVKRGLVSEVQAGGFTIRNVPIGTLPMGAIANMFQMPLKGILGTALLYHFVPTIDYPAGKLVLRKRTPENVKRLAREPVFADTFIIPFWMAGDHYMVARGRVNQSPEVLMFVDTGLAGGGIVCTPSLAEEARIELRSEEVTGTGGGGAVKIKPITAAEVWLGNVRAQEVQGNVGAMPLSLEYAFGFRMPAIISHTFFRPYRLTFDFDRMLLRLKRGRLEK
jgi:predicted aspartyl protease